VVVVESLIKHLKRYVRYARLAVAWDRHGSREEEEEEEEGGVL